MRKNATHSKKPVIIGSAGGSGSGKTLLARTLADKIGKDKVLSLQHDSYYKCLGHLAFDKRTEINFDHPKSLDNDLLVTHMRMLADYVSVEKPVYDSVTHTRCTETVKIYPNDIIIIEGVLILCDERVRNKLDVKVYADTDSDIRFIRRVQRDVNERGRDMGSVVRQYLKTVRDMHLKYVEPTKKFSDIIIPMNGDIHLAVEALLTQLKSQGYSHVIR